MPDIDTAPSLRDLLRSATRSAHDRVDALFGSCDLATPEGYTRFLTAQAAAWRTLAPVLDDGSRARLNGVEADLAALGVPMPPALDDVAKPEAGSLGMSYVLEGSRLGSTILLRDLAERAPELIERAGAYFTASTDLSGWKRLSTILQSQPRNDVSDAAVLADATATFDLFERAFHATARSVAHD
ncbi:biliverdin-producing heme oxygenase [Sphingomonas montanisoli]|uniref:biliverdin-producing heme oxygenase n=1 Tax=Sphingomonas montanisoli TaxID=2606412 RepID=UPI0015E16131|nr:biliverdin-producing heme oxygenase [Sphingomonas montanisoli]